MSHVLLLVGIIFLLLLCNGFFSGSEIAVISMRRSKIEALVAQGRRSARRLKHLQEHIDDFLATAQIGVTFMGTLAGVLGGYLASLYVEPAIARTPVARWIAPAVAATFLVGMGIVYVELVDLVYDLVRLGPRKRYSLTTLDPHLQILSLICHLLACAGGELGAG